MDINTDVFPSTATVFARQLIQRETNITVRNLITSMRVVDRQRSENNPHGFMIQNFTVLRNDTEETIVIHNR
jgi:hypothetical protein